jgi:hypothetical protein
MTSDLIYVEPRQEAVLRYGEESVSCRTVPEAWLAWAQLEADQKARAIIEVGDEAYDVWAIRRLRYVSMADAA